MAIAFLSLLIFIEPVLAGTTGLTDRLTARQLANGQIHIIAVMAEFQEDNNRFTTGNGTFNPDYLARHQVTLDPLPHDKGYFEAHLEFARNYYHTVSGGRLEITYEVLPQIVTLPREMAGYSPIGPGNDENFKLAELARDTWNEVHRANLLTIDPPDPDRTMFIIFHAGAGRDLELIGTTLDKTPQDIPSVFLSSESISRLLDAPDFDGFPITSQTRVKNTAILPETQSRPGQDILGNEFVLEISLNGIVTAMVGSFLGLPDLFNTESGRSGIGRFGLMDGAGFFSYYGLFPPEPMAWEKYYLGWIEPVDITQQVQNSTEELLFHVPAASLRQPDSVFRYSVTGDEYFLVENRHRDPHSNGLTLTVREPDGSITQVTLSNDEERFNPFDFSKINEIIPPGVVIDVSNFDWSLPGGIDPGRDRQIGTDDDRELNGGILIWHIDEQVIRAKRESNTINNDPTRMGVRLMEADGSQDIGQPSAGVTGYDQGNAFDFWWNGNDFTVITATGQRIVLYQNRFGDDTFPNNRTHSGSRTYFELFDFSETSKVASFKARRTGDSKATPLPIINLPLENAPYTQTDHLPTPYPYSLNVWINPETSDTLLIVPLNHHTLVTNLTRNTHAILQAPFNPSQPLVTDDGLIVRSTRISPGAPHEPASSTRVHRLNELDFTGTELQTYSGTVIADIYTRGLPSKDPLNIVQLDRTTHSLSFINGQIQPLTGIRDIQRAGSSSQTVATLEDSDIMIQNNRVTTVPAGEADNERFYLAPTTVDSQQTLTWWSDSQITTIDPGDGTIIGSFSPGSFSWPQLIDFNGNGSTDFLITNYSNNTIEIRNHAGAVADGFPLTPPRGMEFQGTPLLLTATSTQRPVIIVMADDGFSRNILVYSTEDLRSPLHTLIVGSTSDKMPIQPVIWDGILYAVSTDGQIRRWKLNDRTDQPGTYMYGDAASNKQFHRSTDDTQRENSLLLVTSETYNWPNPASHSTFIRTLTTEKAEITVTVINYSGQKIAEYGFESPTGHPFDFEIDTTRWSNGVYYARVTARAGGKTEHKVITMVVIKR